MGRASSVFKVGLPIPLYVLLYWHYPHRHYNDTVYEWVNEELGSDWQMQEIDWEENENEIINERIKFFEDYWIR